MKIIESYHGYIMSYQLVLFADREQHAKNTRTDRRH